MFNLRREYLEDLSLFQVGKLKDQILDKLNMLQ